jgi:hypothetical protein
MPERGWAALTLALTALALVLLFAIVPHAVTGDAYVRYQKLDALLRQGTLAPQPYSLIGPFFASPFWLSGGQRVWWVARFNVLVLAAGVAVTWVAVARAVPPGERASAALLLAASGMLPNATRDFYGELFSTMLVGTGLLVVWVHGRGWGWIAVVLGVANTPATMVGLLLVALHRVWTRRRIDGLVALAAAAAIALIENQLTRDRAFDFGYTGNHGVATMLPFSGLPGFSYPVLLGVLSLLVSFGKGLLFFAPALLLVGHARRERPALGPFLDSTLVFLAGLLVVYGHFWSWYGGWRWGPRYLLFAAYPSSIALAVALARPTTLRVGALGLVIALWTIWVGVSGVVFDLTGLGDCLANGWALEHLCWYVPEYSPLLRPFVLPTPSLTGWQIGWLLFAAVAGAVLVTSGPALEDLGAAVARTIRDRGRA